jgi:hypothetical protein
VNVGAWFIVKAAAAVGLIAAVAAVGLAASGR